MRLEDTKKRRGVNEGRERMGGRKSRFTERSKR